MSHEDLDDEFGGGKKEKSFVEIPCASLVFSSFEERKKRSAKEKEKKEERCLNNGKKKTIVNRGEYRKNL